MWDRSIIILATKEGKILWQRELPYSTWTPNEAVVAEGFGIWGILDGLETKVPGEEKLKEVYAFFLDWQGNMKWTSPLHTRGEMVLQLDEREKRLYISGTWGYLFCIDANLGKILWSYKESWSPIGFHFDSRVLDDAPLFDELKIDSDFVFIKGYFRRRHTPVQNWYASVLLYFGRNSGTKIGVFEYPQSKIHLMNVQNNNLWFLDITQKHLSCVIFERRQK